MARWGWLVVGIAIGAIVLAPLGLYTFARFGGIAMATTAKPLPFEETIAKTALRSSMAGAGKMQNPLPAGDENLIAGAQIYGRQCAICHGLPQQPKTMIARGEFPPPPQLFEAHEMVTDDPEGATYWKVSHGIRLSGMPGFGDTLSDTERWQVTMLLKYANELSPAVKGALQNSAH